MSPLPEERQLAAAQRLRPLGQRRRKLKDQIEKLQRELAEVDAELRPAVREEREAGSLSDARLIELAQIGRTTFFDWVRGTTRGKRGGRR